MADPLKKLTEIPGPDYRSTAPVAKPTQVEIMIGEMRTEMRDRLETVTNLVLDVGQRVSTLETAEQLREERTRKHSGGITRVSENDAKQDAVIAQLVTTVQAIEQKTDLQTRILERGEEAGKKLWANPYVKAIAVGLALYILAVLKKHGIEVVP